MNTKRLILALVLLLTVVGATTALANDYPYDYDDKSPTGLGVVPDEAPFPDGRITCPEGSYPFFDQFQNGEPESITYDIMGIPVTVSLDFHEPGLFDITITNGTISWLGVKSRLYLIYEWDPSVSYDTWVHTNVKPSGGGYQGLSHLDFCLIPGEEELTVTKGVTTYFERQHLWDIAKRVETENGYLEDGLPKIRLDGSALNDETATWIVDVSYQGYYDLAYNVSGYITIENTGDVEASIQSVEDVLAGTSVPVGCAVMFPYVLPVGETLTCSYGTDVSSKLEGFNVATVTTGRDSYSSEAAPITWGEPDVEHDETVNISDLSDLFGTQPLGSVTAPNGDTFTYSKDFTWAEYADFCGQDFVYDNTATIVETGQDADATLKVNVLCAAIEVNKVYKNAATEDPDDTLPLAGAGFTLYDAAGMVVVQAEKVTDADGKVCFGGLPLNTNFTLKETTVPGGFQGADDLVVNSNGESYCGSTEMPPVQVTVTNIPLTDITWSVDSQVDGATETLVICYDSNDVVVYSNTVSDGDHTFEGLIPTAPGVTLRCEFTVDP